MIVKEFLATREDGVNLYITYSDKGYPIRQIETGVIYEDAVDVEGAPYTYEEFIEETDEEIENAEEEISAEEFMTLVEEML